MTYSNLIKLANAKDESSRSNRALVLPASLAIGSGMGLGSRYFVNKAEDMQNDIRKLKSSIPELDPRLRNELDTVNAEIAKNKEALEDIKAGASKFEADKKLYHTGHTFSESHKNIQQYYDDTDAWLKNRTSALEEDHHKLQARAKNASDSLQASSDEITSLKNKLNDVKKAQARALTKGKVLGIMGLGLVGGGLIHNVASKRRERK